MFDHRDSVRARHARPTMRDVAALAGVAIKTVSRVMNGEPTVAADLAARVHDAADKLGYRPNLTASSLRRGDGRSSTIGVLLGDVANPFSAALMRTIEDLARRRNVQVLIGSLDEDPERERQLARTLIDRRVDGLIIVPSGTDQSYLQAERRLGLTVVFLDREPRLVDGDSVVSDNRSGARAATDHLLAHGHVRLGFLGDDLRIATAQERYAGYLDALQRAGIGEDAAIVRHDLRTVGDAATATGEILSADDPSTAIFASQNLITIGATRELHDRRVHRDVALVGFDDFLLADVLEPGITVITQDTAAMGTLAADLLFRRLDGDESPPQSHLIPTGMVLRGSGEIRRTVRLAAP